MLSLANWLVTVDASLGASVRGIMDDYEVDPTTLMVPRGSVRDLALGSVLGGEHGVGQINKLSGADTVRSGSGLWLLQDVSVVVMAPMDDVGFAA